MLIIIITICLLFFIFLNASSNSAVKESYRNTLGKEWMKIWNYTYFPMYVWATRQLDKNDVHRILDVGVGNGRSSIFFERNLSKKYSYRNR